VAALTVITFAGTKLHQPNPQPFFQLDPRLIIPSITHHIQSSL